MCSVSLARQLTSFFADASYLLLTASITTSIEAPRAAADTFGPTVWRLVTSTISSISF